MTDILEAMHEGGMCLIEAADTSGTLPLRRICQSVQFTAIPGQAGCYRATVIIDTNLAETEVHHVQE